jgi:hypothetical protein
VEGFVLCWILQEYRSIDSLDPPETPVYCNFTLEILDKLTHSALLDEGVAIYKYCDLEEHAACTPDLELHYPATKRLL